MSAYDWDDVQQTVHHFVDVEPSQQPEGKGGKRSRQTYSKYQTAVLETVFRTSKYIVRSKRQQMSAELNLTERQIKIWFQNRRMKEKKCRKEMPRMNDFAAATPDYPPLPPSLPSSTINNNNPLTFDDYHCRTESKPPQALDHGVGYAGFGYDHLQLTSPDPYADKTNSTQWPEVDFHQDFYGDQDLDRFQRLPMTHHHMNQLNSQVPDYNCSPAQLLQAAHGY